MKEREIVGSILKSDGSRVDVYLLKTRDLVDADINSPDLMYKLCAKAIGVTYDDFMDWDIDDCMKVMQLVGSSISVLSGVCREIGNR